MADNFVQLPDDSPNTGKKVRTHSETVSGNEVHTHVFVPAVDADGSGSDIPVSNSNPLPVVGTLTISGPVAVTGPLTDAQLRAAAVPVSVASLPLPSGAATEATLATRLSESDFDTKIGSLTETAPTTDTASSGLNGRLQRIAQRMTSLIALLPAALVGGRFDTNIGAWLGSTTPTVGQKTMAASLPVVVASDQTAVPENLTQLNGNTINVGNGLISTGTARVTLASDDPAVASLSSIDGKLVTARTADYDSGAGTVTTEFKGIALPASGGPVAGGTASNPIRTDPTGTTTQPVSMASVPLPSGAATEATLATRLSESDFDTKVGSLTETAPSTDTASSGLNGRLQRIAQRLTSLIALLPAALVGGRFDINNGAWLGSTAPTVGQKAMASSVPVVVASDQSAVPISAASLPLPSGAATETTLGTRLSESDFDTKTGSLTETAPSTDTASSGLNGRLQRVAQRITSLIAVTPDLVNVNAAIKNEDSASADLGSGFASLFVRQDTPANTSNNDGDFEYPKMSAGRIWASVKIDTALPTGSNVIGALSANQSVNVAQINGVTPLMGSGNTGTGSPRVTLATDQVALTTAGLFSVKIDQTTDGTTNKVAATQATAANLNAQVVGNVAHDAADAGNPIKLGGRAVDFGTTPTAVTLADRTDWLFTRSGMPFVLGGHPNILTAEYQFGTAAATDFKMVDVSAGTRIVVVGYSVMVSAACTVNVAARIGFGDSSADTTLDAIGTSAGTPTATQMVMSHPNIAPGSGVISNNGSIITAGGDGCDLFATIAASTGGKVNVIVWYFTIATG